MGLDKGSKVTCAVSLPVLGMESKADGQALEPKLAQKLSSVLWSCLLLSGSRGVT